LGVGVSEDGYAVLTHPNFRIIEKIPGYGVHVVCDAG